MDAWYFGTGGDELVVPKEQEDSGMLLSSESWMQWGIDAPDSFWLPDKHIVTETKPVRDLTFMGKNLSNEVDNSRSIFTHERDQSSGSSVCEGGSSVAVAHQSMLPREWPDDLEGINEMDDMFLSSMLEDLPNTENSRGSFCFPLRPQCSNTPREDQLTDTMFDSERIARNSHGSMNNSKYLKTNSSPSVDWDNKDVTSSRFDPFDLRENDGSSLKSPVDNFIVPSEQSIENWHMGDEASVEESILQQLGLVMEQMTDKTRLCFRDALYRLAENSKQYIYNQELQDDLEVDKMAESVAQDETIRSESTKIPESETNTIDRAVANLMFGKMELNAQELHASVSDISEQGKIPTTNGAVNEYISNPSKMPLFHQCIIVPGDAEVPIFSQRIDCRY